MNWQKVFLWLLLKNQLWVSKYLAVLWEKGRVRRWETGWEENFHKWKTTHIQKKCCIYHRIMGWKVLRDFPIKTSVQGRNPQMIWDKWLSNFYLKTSSENFHCLLILQHMSLQDFILSKAERENVTHFCDWLVSKNMVWLVFLFIFPIIPLYSVFSEDMK